MRFFIYLTSFVFSTNICAQSPTVQWAKNFIADSASAMQVIDAHADQMGKVLVSGFMSGTVNIGPTSLQYSSSAGCLVCYRADGTHAWSGIFPPGNINSSFFPMLVSHDRTGNVLVSGMLTGTVDLDPGPGQFFFTSQSSYSILSTHVVIKLNNAGQLQWVKQFGDRVGVQKITADSSGNIILAGHFTTPCDLDPGAGVSSPTISSGYFVTKLNPSGSFKFAATASSGGGRIHALSTDGNGRINIGGYSFNQSVPSNLAPAPAIFNSTITAGFVLRLDSNGVFSDGTLIPGCILITSIETDKFNNRLLSGLIFSSSNNIDLDPGPAVAPVNSMVCAFVEKLDVNGALVWLRKIEAANGYSGHWSQYARLISDITGNSWLCLDAGGNGMIFQNTVGTVSVQNTYPWPFYALAHYDANGNIVWAGDVGPANSTWTWWQIVEPFAVTNTGDIYLSAMINKPCELEPVSGSFTVTPVNYSSTFLEKISLCGSSGQVALTSVNYTICKGEETYLIATGAMNYQWQPYAPPASMIAVTPSISTVYELAGIDGQGCMYTATTAVMVDECTSVVESENKKVRLFPNPAANNIFIETFYPGTFSLKDLFGKEYLLTVTRQNTTKISLSEIPSGIYLWELQTEAACSKGKLIKE